MLFFKIPLLSVSSYIISIINFLNFNKVWANNFITRGTLCY
jgi:hypothetical protein